MITREDSETIAVLRMAHGKVSALDMAMCERMVAEIESVAASSSLALVLTGTGSAFSAGVDLFQVLSGGGEYLSRFLPAMGRLFRTLLTFRKPAVAAINGHAIAGGCIMAAACDHRIMASGPARIGVPELVVGVPFPTLPFEIVGARVDPKLFRHLVYSGRTVPANEALEVGFVDEVVPPGELVSRAIAVARQLTQIPTKTFELTKRTFTAPLLARVDTSSPINDDVIAAWRSPEVLERMQRYVDLTIGKTH